MVFRPLLQQRAVVPAMTALVGAGMLFNSPRQVHAEEPPYDPHRKPIYDDSSLSNITPTSSSAAVSASPSIVPDSESYRPTPTDRLAVQIGHVRLAAYRQATRAEDSINNALTETFRLEHSFTSTIRSLAPPKESGEKIFPGALYVLVASMAGSILTRNRNIILRASVPAAIGIGAAYAVLPITMRNVGDLAWTYEERYPALAEAHLKTKARISKFLETGKAHSSMTFYRVQDKVEETRERLEDWVKKGR
ncbi:hypothetical protein BU24DRAFT_454276 [Aaosphaeria arxii CBS 175.79]|uniref:MICOS complex subunit n=1 Tax=Aaosphaeria arxii CBS 175.79 TaxID=1450172 RepID=A0A6A5XG20_9PLEO|nr:uncharacterized protein BU24DRAFT_454276 [Aaosphaeria arxii CBS 175.79]KAF2011796.1 hypothetical protein BU24DRAFT_454276 [Aaosphaeria arxii CBS 175.79]